MAAVPLHLPPACAEELDKCLRDFILRIGVSTVEWSNERSWKDNVELANSAITTCFTLLRVTQLI